MAEISQISEISAAEKISTCSLSSGSSGNAVFVGCGDVNILIDAGRSAKVINGLLAEIGRKISDISAIFITHEHIDHVSALKVLINRNKIPVYMVWESFDNLSDDYKSVLGGVINFISPFDKDKNSVNIGGLTVECYSTPHDSAASVGYVIKHEGKKAVGIATDIGYVTKEMTEAVCGCKIIYMESNHDLEMLKNSSYPAQIKQRIKSRRGHLSNIDCAETLPYFIKNGAEKIILYHLSGENNTKELAMHESKKSILSAKLNAGTVYLGVAPKSSPSKMMNIRFAQEQKNIKNIKNIKETKPIQAIQTVNTVNNELYSLNPLGSDSDKKVIHTPLSKMKSREIPEIDIDDLNNITQEIV